MKKLLGFIVSLIMILSMVGCMENNVNSSLINPNSFNSASNTDENSKKTSSSFLNSPFSAVSCFLMIKI